MKCSKIVALNKKIHFPAVVNKEVFLFGKNRGMGGKYFVYLFSVLFKDEAIFLAFHVFGQFVKVLQKVACVGILRRSGYV